MKNSLDPLKDLLGPLFEPSVAVGKWLGNKLDKIVDEVFPLDNSK